MLTDFTNLWNKVWYFALQLVFWKHGHAWFDCLTVISLKVPTLILRMSICMTQPLPPCLCRHEVCSETWESGSEAWTPQCLGYDFQG